MSVEVFPLKPLRAADVIDKPIEGFTCTKSEHAPDTYKLEHAGRIVVAYAGNGSRTFDRGYREDAVWFEIFGLGGALGSAASGEFFDALGKALGCEFITELGQKLTLEEGVDSDDWGGEDDDYHRQAIEAMQRAPGSTGGTKIYEIPHPSREYPR